MATFEIDTAAIRQLAALLEETGLSEIEVGNKDQKLRVARQAAAAAPAAPTVVVNTAAPPSEDPGLHPGAVRSPMVGTVYLAAEPTAAPFVKLGDQVAPGQTLLIIEAMKVMNQIPAPKAGRVTQVLVENGSPVEYGQVLL